MSKKVKITDASIVPANGRPEEVKVGYRTIKIKYVNPNFIMDDMTDSYGEYRARGRHLHTRLTSPTGKVQHYVA